MVLHETLAFIVNTAFLSLLVVAILYALIYRAISSLQISDSEKKSSRIFYFGILFGWLILIVILGQLNFFHVAANALIPNPMVLIALLLPLFLGIFVLPSTKNFQSILEHMFVPGLIFVHFFRIGGYVFLVLMAQGLLPSLFAIPSAFGDVIAGLTAPLVAFYYWKKMKKHILVAKIWNFFGLLDLITAVSLGILLVFSSPFQIIPVNPTTELMTVFPLVMVPAFAIPLGILLHVYTFKRLK